MKLNIGGTAIPQVLQARVNISNSKNNSPVHEPVVSMEILLRMHHETLIADWATAPEGRKRFKRVELVMESRDALPLQVFTIPYAWISSYEACENNDYFFDAQGREFAGAILKITIQASLPPGMDHNGHNLIDASPGETPIIKA